MGILDDIANARQKLLEQSREPYPTGAAALPPMSPAAAVRWSEQARADRCRARLHARDGVTVWHCHRDRGHPMTPPDPMPHRLAVERNLHYGEDIEPGHPMQWRDSAFGAVTDEQARWLDS